jgi:hypothetical protein
MLSKTSTPSCTFFKTLSISPCNFLDAPIISKMSSVIGWVQEVEEEEEGRDQIKSGRAHTLSHQIHSQSFIIFSANLVDDNFIFASFFSFLVLCG